MNNDNYMLKFVLLTPCGLLMDFKHTEEFNEKKTSQIV